MTVEGVPVNKQDRQYQTQHGNPPVGLYLNQQAGEANGGDDRVGEADPPGRLAIHMVQDAQGLCPHQEAAKQEDSSREKCRHGIHRLIMRLMKEIGPVLKSSPIFIRPGMIPIASIPSRKPTPPWIA